MAIQLSERVKLVKPSPTLAVAAKAKELKAQGRPIVGLGTGEPDFDTPEHIKQAAIEAIKGGATKYTPVDGTPELKQAVIDKFKRDNNLDYQANQILVSCGGKQSFYNLCQALINDGDEVIIPAPYWVSYPDMAILAGGKPVIIETTIEQHLKITPEQLRNAITDKTKLFVINSPSNPTGVAYSKEELKALADVLLEFPNIVVATDDMYEHILWTEQPFVNILNVCPELYDRTVVLNGVSKAYAMTGWRIGYAGGPADLIGAMKKIQSQSTSNPAAPSQAAATAALAGDQSCIKPMLAAFKRRHDYLVDALNSIEGVTCLPSDGTFYAFPNMQGLIDKHGCESDLDFAELLIEKVDLALVPGSAFGAPGHLRLSYAASMDTLEEAIVRLRKMA
ncbi:pyridoxal phosphate-dependent aminotransferase [Kangiella koreensis]|uniref:Aminotransferase n=1 Tax=Kangiella koreensis (strain DSM 16069 / JCM 12317 / KCTC 12182 / SW-125) TaxID=523791 RepID=C7RAN8_KANKD|nr:pyridoxal phosphate-dependent aminotransferase [Kangiella koreensis]ACV26330.1 aminotransferase class I and II [Kangiella koreensis DSM 16069]